MLFLLLEIGGSCAAMLTVSVGYFVSYNSFLGSQPRMVIWGTDVVVEDCREKFSRFLKTYKCSEFDSQGEIILSDFSFLNVSFQSILVSFQTVHFTFKSWKD